MHSLHNIDCLEYMQSMEPGSVDAILTDLPYGTTACAWDTVIPFEPMWKAVKHVLKPDGAFVTTASQPFTSVLVNSNLAWFKYEWVWFKNKGSNFLSVEYRPLKEHENVLVFSGETAPYNPQHEIRSESGIQRMKYKMDSHRGFDPITKQKTTAKPRVEMGNKKMPGSIQFFICEMGKHPTQKPVALYKYLVQTYTNPGDTVLDMCMGSGTTGVACIETGRDFVGCETDKEHFQTAEKRIEQASRQGQLFKQPVHKAPARAQEQCQLL